MYFLPSPFAITKRLGAKIESKSEIQLLGHRSNKKQKKLRVRFTRCSKKAVRPYIWTLSPPTDSLPYNKSTLQYHGVGSRFPLMCTYIYGLIYSHIPHISGIGLPYLLPIFCIYVCCTVKHFHLYEKADWKKRNKEKSFFPLLPFFSLVFFFFACLFFGLFVCTKSGLFGLNCRTAKRAC